MPLSVILLFQALLDEGKIRGVGLSEIGPEQIRATAAVVPIAAIEQEYSLFVRDLEVSWGTVVDIVGLLRIAAHPVAVGLLTGCLFNSSCSQVGPPC